LTAVRSSRRGFNCPRRRGVHVRRQRACGTGPNPDLRVDRVDSPQPEGEPSIARTTASTHAVEAVCATKCVPKEVLRRVFRSTTNRRDGDGRPPEWGHPEPRDDLLFPFVSTRGNNPIWSGPQVAQHDDDGRKSVWCTGGGAVESPCPFLAVQCRKERKPLPGALSQDDPDLGNRSS